MSKFKKHRTSSSCHLNKHGMVTQGCKEIWWLEHDAHGAGNEAAERKQRPDFVKALCHPEKFILEFISKEKPTLDHNDLSHFWPGLEHSLNILLIWYLFSVLYYFWVPNSPCEHFWDALLCWPTNGPSLMFPFLGWYVFHQVALLPWPQLMGPRISIWPKGNYLWVGQCPGKGTRTKALLSGAIPSWVLTTQTVTHLRSLNVKHTERKTIWRQQKQKNLLWNKAVSRAMTKPNLAGRKQVRQ